MVNPRLRKWIAICVAAGSPLAAQDTCVALLRHGIYNTTHTLQVGASASTIYNQVCSNYNSYKAGTLKADASGKFGLFSASASLTKEEVEAIGQAMCSTNYSDATANNQVDSFSSVVSDAGRNAFTDCVHEANAGLVINTSYDENLPNFVTISARYTPLGNPGTQHVTGYDVKTDNPNAPANLKASCSGNLVTAAGSQQVLTPGAVLTMTCQRPALNDPQNAFLILGNKALAYGATVTVTTDLGPVHFDFAPLYLPAAPSPIKPAFVGEIRSMAFQSNDSAFHDLRANGWMECDGSALNVSEYPELFAALANTWGTTNIGVTFKIPDLRGQFLRGWNHSSNADPEANGRTYADPTNPHAGWTGSSGDAVGSRQADAFAQHHHDLSEMFLDAQSGHGFAGSAPRSNSNPGQAPWTTPVSVTAVGNTYETRPKNVAVMYVIYTGKRP